MKANDVFGGSLLKAADLQGKRVKLPPIKAMSLVDFGDGKETPVLSFDGTDRELSINKTNWNRIVEVTGRDDSDDWVGQTIEIYPDKTEYQGKRVGCIRVFIPDAAPPPAPAEEGEDLPF